MSKAVSSPLRLGVGKAESHFLAKAKASVFIADIPPSFLSL